MADKLDAYLGITDETIEAENEDREEVLESQPEADDPEIDEEGEGEGEDDEVDQAEGEDPQEPVEASYADKTHKVKLEDGTEITVGELIRGSISQADYTRRSQELAVHRKEIESRQVAIAQQEDILDLALNIAAASLPGEPDPQLAQTDPAAYVRQRVQHEGRMRELEQMYMAKQQMAADQLMSHQQAQNELMVKEARRAQELMPELATKESALAFSNDLEKAAAKYGFSPGEIAIEDHRFMLLAKDLIEYQKILSNKPAALEKTKGKPPLSASKRQVGTSTASAMDRLRKSGGKDASALDAILDKYV